MNDRKEPPIEILGNGYAQYQMESFDNLVNLLSTAILDYNSYIWRGQRDPAWKLEPTIRRLPDIDPRQIMHHDMLNRFKKAARGRRGSNPAQLKIDNDWWALGQHHGLATPLLDWSTSPFVAAFFAYLEPYPKELKVENNSDKEIKQSAPKYRAIYALHSDMVDEWATSDLSTAKTQLAIRNAESNGAESPIDDKSLVPAMELVRPMSDENQRLINQGGLFTRYYGSGSIEDWITTRHPKDHDSLPLIKILVPDSDREKALTLLNRMNINALSLFPDLIGASMYSNLHAEIKDY